jgi:hypothetical protein
MFQTPVALISLMVETSHLLLGRAGLDADDAPGYAAFHHSPCMTVYDTRVDCNLGDHAMVTGSPHIRFCAGLPL